MINVNLEGENKYLVSGFLEGEPKRGILIQVICWECFQEESKENRIGEG